MNSQILPREVPPVRPPGARQVCGGGRLPPHLESPPPHPLLHQGGVFHEGGLRRAYEGLGQGQIVAQMSFFIEEKELQTKFMKEINFIILRKLTKIN